MPLGLGDFNSWPYFFGRKPDMTPLEHCPLYSQRSGINACGRRDTGSVRPIYSKCQLH